jgi:hypothetical protein
MKGVWIVLVSCIVIISMLLFMLIKVTQAATAIQEKQYQTAYSDTTLVSIVSGFALAIVSVAIVLIVYFKTK